MIIVGAGTQRAREIQGSLPQAKIRSLPCRTSRCQSLDAPATSAPPGGSIRLELRATGIDVDAHPMRRWPGFLMPGGRQFLEAMIDVTLPSLDAISSINARRTCAKP